MNTATSKISGLIRESEARPASKISNLVHDPEVRSAALFWTLSVLGTSGVLDQAGVMPSRQTTRASSAVPSTLSVQKTAAERTSGS